MIVIDSSALLAILLDEPEADRCAAILASTDQVLLSAGTLCEALIVAERRGVRAELEQLVAELAMEVVSVSVIDARGVADAYACWGKGIHPAGLNFGDCFAYSLCKRLGARLLFVGNDFTQTDIDQV